MLGRKSRLKERIKNPTTLGVNPMAQVTYRGVQYDTEEYNKKVLAEANQHRNFDLMYRGLKVTKKLAAV